MPTGMHARMCERTRARARVSMCVCVCVIRLRLFSQNDGVGGGRRNEERKRERTKATKKKWGSVSRSLLCVGDCVTEVLRQLATCTSLCRGRMEEGGGRGGGGGGEEHVRCQGCSGRQRYAEERVIKR